MIDARITAKAGALWSFRAHAELEAAARFRRLAALLRDTGARRIVVDMARTAAGDELRHHVRCRALAQRFGGSVSSSIEPAAAPLRTDGCAPAEQVLYEAVAMSCVTETLSTALLLEMRTAATDDEVRDTVDEILRDEVEHARLGWAHVAAEVSRRDLAYLGPQLPAMLAHTVHAEIFAEHDDVDAAPLAGLGALPRSRRCALFVQCMRDVVFPGLALHGVDTTIADAWLAARVG
jgi:hypothetical protein